jgi:hypothetical protein
MLRLCSGMLTLGSGKSGSCSHLETKTELAKEKLILSLWAFIRHVEMAPKLPRERLEIQTDAMPYEFV